MLISIHICKITPKKLLQEENSCHMNLSMNAYEYYELDFE